MKNLPLYLSLLFLLTCAKEDSQTPNNQPSNIVSKYTLTASAGDGGSVSTTGGTFSQGTQVSITATPNTGYSFSGWSNGSTANPLTVNLNSNTTVTANFQLIVTSYTLTVSAGEGGSVLSEGGEYEEGTEVTITATPDEGYEFTGWSDGETSISRVVTISSDTTLSASFEILTFQLTIVDTEDCNTPFYSEMPSPDYSENNYDYYSYVWQTEEGMSKICVNSYAGVSDQAKALINQVLIEASNKLGQLVPVNITAYYNGISDLELVMANWKALKMDPNGFEPSDYTAAAGVEFSNIHNGGQGELSQGIWELEEAKKIIYHEFFHIHQNSHKFYFEDTNNFGWDESRIVDRSSSNYIPLVGPVWLEEGGADFAAIMLSSERNWIDLKSFFTSVLDEAREVISEAQTREDIVSLEDYNTSDNIRRFESSENPTGTTRLFAYQYTGGSLAHLYILRTGRATFDNMIFDYFTNLAELEREHYGEGYKYSFEAYYGISLEDFYMEFDEFMLKSREEQLTILELN